MTLVQSWVDSLTLLKPKNLQLFVMVTIKSILEAYTLYFKYFWWLLLALPLLCLFIMPNGSIQYIVLLCIVYFLYGILFLGTCFITRPSILQKDCTYFRTQFKKIILYWLLLMLLLVPLFLVSSYSPWYVFFILFFADSEGGFKNFLLSMWNGLKMMLYNFPLIFVMNFCCSVLVFIVNYMFVITPLTQAIIGAFLIPIGVCTYANIYIKKLHDQFDLYFKQSQ